MNPSNEQLGVFLLCLASLLGVAYFVKELFVRKPTLEREFVSREEFERFQTRLDNHITSLELRLERNHTAISVKLDEMKDSAAEASERRTNEVYERINEVKEMVDRVDERTKLHE